MDVALGVVVAGEDARIALREAAPPHSVIDQSQARVVGGDIEELVSTLVATDRTLTDTGHRLVSTRICSDQAGQAGRVVAALTGADLTNVTAVAQPDATTPETAAVAGLTGPETTASPAVQADSAAMTGVAPVTAAADPVWTTESVWSAQGAEAAGAAGLADPAMTMLSSQGSQLAYSEVDEGDGLDDSWVPVPGGDGLDDGWVSVAEGGDPDETGFIGQPTPGRPKALLLGSSVAAAVVVGFAGLAVSVAVGIRPTSSEQAIRMQQESVPGKYFPTSPGQGVKPDGENWTVIEKLPPKGVDATVRTFEPKSLTQPLSSTGSVIDLYPDGTFGVRSAAAPLPTVIPPVPDVLPGVIPPVADVAGGVDPLTMFLVARLIPDFTRFTPIDVLSVMSNMTSTAIQTAGVVGTNALSNLSTAVAGPSLADLGSVVAVSPLQGALFATAPAAAQSAFDPATLTTSVPPQLFSAGVTPEEKAALLPAGVTEITELPDTGGNAGLSPLSTPITDVDALHPTVVGTGPEVIPDKEAPPVFPDLATTPAKPATPQGPKDASVSELPENAPAPGEQAPSEGSQQQAPDAVPGEAPAESPGKQAPAEAPGQVPTEAPVEAPTEAPTRKPAPTEAPREAPKEAPKEAPNEAPAEAPTQKPAPAEVPEQAPAQKPAPTQQAPPVQQEPSPAPAKQAPVEVPAEAPAAPKAPVQQAPEPAPVQQAPPKAPEPAPVQQAPVQQAPPKAPVQQAPPQAPVQQAPAQQAPKAPKMPSMPDLSGGLFG